MLARTAVARTSVPCMRVLPIARPRGRPFAQQNRGLRARAWWLMRQLRRFTLDDLLFTVAKVTDKDAKSNLGKFISGLERVGVLSRLHRCEPGQHNKSGGHVIWRLTRDLGPKAPVWRATPQVLYDPNSGALLPKLAGLAATPATPAATKKVRA